MTRLLARIPTPHGPRTISVPRLAPEDAALLGHVIADQGGEFVLRDDVSSLSVTQILKARKRVARPKKSNVAYLHTAKTRK